ncbi:MAG: hypothetical protein SW833_27545 [Cyanobacteriota bacterium]|nr:hypothetical protein [Cyanobacteriota bacterium]
MATVPPSISLELPEPLYQALLAHQQQRGYSSVAIAMTRILEEFLQPQTQNPPNWATQEQLQILEAKVERLSQLVHLLQNRAFAVAETAQGVQSPPRNTNFARPSSFAITDDIDDEPDEILYDFLE